MNFGSDRELTLCIFQKSEKHEKFLEIVSLIKGYRKCPRQLVYLGTWKIAIKNQILLSTSCYGISSTEYSNFFEHT